MGDAENASPHRRQLCSQIPKWDGRGFRSLFDTYILLRGKSLKQCVSRQRVPGWQIYHPPSASRGSWAGIPLGSPVSLSLSLSFLPFSSFPCCLYFVLLAIRDLSCPDRHLSLCSCSVLQLYSPRLLTPLACVSPAWTEPVSRLQSHRPHPTAAPIPPHHHHHDPDCSASRISQLHVCIANSRLVAVGCIAPQAISSHPSYPVNLFLNPRYLGHPTVNSAFRV